MIIIDWLIIGILVNSCNLQNRRLIDASKYQKMYSLTMLVMMLITVLMSCQNDVKENVVYNDQPGAVVYVLDATHVIVKCVEPYSKNGNYQVVLTMNGNECTDATCLCADCDFVIEQGQQCGSFIDFSKEF